MTTISNRLEALEARLIQRGATWAQRLTAWRQARAQGLEFDDKTGEVVTLEDLRRRDPQRAQALEARRRQAAEAMAMIDDDRED